MRAQRSRPASESLVPERSSVVRLVKPADFAEAGVGDFVVAEISAVRLDSPRQ